MAETKSQFKINKLAKDLGVKSKLLVDLLAAKEREVTVQKTLEPIEFDLLFDALTKENQISNIGDYLEGKTYIPSKLPKAKPQAKPQAEPKPEEKTAEEKPKAAEKPAEAPKAEKAETPKEPAKPTEPKPAAPTAKAAPQATQQGAARPAAPSGRAAFGAAPAPKAPTRPQGVAGGQSAGFGNAPRRRADGRIRRRETRGHCGQPSHNGLRDRKPQPAAAAKEATPR